MHNLNTLTECISDDESTRQFGINYITGINKEEFICYTDLKRRSLKLLTLLNRYNLAACREVVIFTKENKYLVDCFFASIFGGKIASPVSGSSKLENIKKLDLILGKMSSPLLAIECGLEDAINEYIDENPDSHLAKTRYVVVHESLYLDADEAPIATVNREDIAFIQFSSGSTSEPKGVTLTHENVLKNVNSLYHNSKFEAHEEMVSWMPLTHDMGMIGSLLCMVIFNYNTHIISTELFSRRPLIWLDACSRKKATITMSPNFGYKHTLKYVDDSKLKDIDLSHIRRIYNGAEPVSIDLCHEFMDRMQRYNLNPSSMLMVYGLAEATVSVTMAEILQPFHAISVDRNSLNIEHKVEYATTDVHQNQCIAFPSVGKSVVDCNVRVASPETNAPLSSDEIGEVQISGPAVTAGYYNDPDATKRTFTQDGWLKTGDLGFLDSEQRLFITGRLKELIIINGKNFYPHDLDKHLHDVQILELGKIACVGVAGDANHSEGFIVYLATKDNPDLFAALRKKTLSTLSENYGISPLAVIPVSSIPKTTSGKIKRVELGQRFKRGEFAHLLNPDLKADAEKSASWRTETEKKLLEALQKLIAYRPLGRNDNFLELGIESIVLAQFHAFIDEHYPNTVHVMDLYERPLISAIAEIIDQKTMRKPTVAY